jgi:hypothetical protein
MIAIPHPFRRLREVAYTMALVKASVISADEARHLLWRLPPLPPSSVNAR